MHSINEETIRFSQKCAFWGKNRFSGILKFLRIFWSDLDGAIGFFQAVDMDQLLILSINDFIGPLNAKNTFNFESITYSVKKGKTYLLVLGLF